jgi:competence protein ComEC
MSKFTTFLEKLFSLEKDDLWLWPPVFIGFGAAFYISYQKNFLDNFFYIIALFGASLILYFLNQNSRRSLIFLGCALFLLGGFYANLYQKTFLSHTKISGKVYVDAVGKIESVKKFHNSRTGADGVSLVISDLVLYKAKFTQETSNKTNKSVTKKSANKKTKKPKKSFSKTEQKNLVNLPNYQEIDRKFLDYSKNYQQVEWQKIDGKDVFPNAPKKILVNLVKNYENVAINDVVEVKALLQPPESKEFSDSFDFEFAANFKKIGAFGFALGEARILKKAEISNIDNWFLALREKVRGKIYETLSGDYAAISSAFLIGDKSEVSPNLMAQIRNSGLAHLLAISGFHMSLAGAICFIVVRFLLSRSQYFTLNFEIKKVAAIAAIFGTYFYLKIADSPIPAQRAFLMVLLALGALFVGQKVNSRRAIMTVVLALILSNPYAIFNVSFQLSFAAILILSIFYEERNLIQNRNIFRRLFSYFIGIILLSILVQIATIPFLMKSFQNVTLLGFLANIFAIPLVSFAVMPLGFLALFLMPLSLEKYALLGMNQGILLLEKIAIFVSDLDYSHFASPSFSSFGLAVAIVGLLIFCLVRSDLRFFGIVIFALSFLTVFFQKQPTILFDEDQKFFAIFDKGELFFSKNLKPSKKRKLWMDKMKEDEFKFLESCDETKCIFTKNKKFLVLLGRNKISEICKNDFDVIVNLTAKYQTPDCFSREKIIIDNSNFYYHGGHFFYFDDEMTIKTSY